jgi:CDGSH-type Zn-finger protein
VPEHDDDPPTAARPPGRKQGGPFVAKCPPGKYAWCRCQRSASYPYCDGSHRGSDVTPIKVVVDEERTVVWCACGASRNQPYCDGSHSRTN